MPEELGQSNHRYMRAHFIFFLSSLRLIQVSNWSSPLHPIIISGRCTISTLRMLIYSIVAGLRRICRDSLILLALNLSLYPISIVNIVETFLWCTIDWFMGVTSSLPNISARVTCRNLTLCGIHYPMKKGTVGCQCARHLWLEDEHIYHWISLIQDWFRWRNNLLKLGFY